MPAIVLPTGPMATGSHRGERLGACTDCRRLWGRFRAGEIDAAEIAEINDRLVSSVGTCTVMGTASTMACLAEAMGLTLPMAGLGARHLGRAGAARRGDRPRAPWRWPRPAARPSPSS